MLKPDQTGLFFFFLLDQKEAKNQGYESNASESRRVQPKPGETRL